jgi:hypothetical protein
MGTELEVVELQTGVVEFGDVVDCQQIERQAMPFAKHVARRGRWAVSRDTFGKMQVALPGAPGCAWALKRSDSSRIAPVKRLASRGEGAKTRARSRAASGGSVGTGAAVCAAAEKAKAVKAAAIALWLRKVFVVMGSLLKKLENETEIAGPN